MPNHTDSPPDAGDDEGAVFAARLAAGDAAAFEMLFARYFNRLRRYAYGYTRVWVEAEDLVHDVFLRLWHRRRWLGQVRALDAYVYRVTRNLSLNHVRRRAIEERWRVGEATGRAAACVEHTARPTVAEQELAAGERVAAIVRALDTLPPRQREVMLLRWRDGRSQEEIATRLGISKNTLEIHVTRAHKRLRKLLAGLLAP